MAEAEHERWPLPLDGGGDVGRLDVGDVAATVLDAMDRPGYVCDRRHGLVAWNDRFGDAMGDRHEYLAGMDPTEFVTDEDTPRAREALERVAGGEEVTVEVALSTSDGPRVREVTATPLREDGAVRGLVGVIREPAGRRNSGRSETPGEATSDGVHGDAAEHERQAERSRTRRDELATLNRINELVQETIGALATAASREEIEEIVCDRLAESSLYRFAFTGTGRPGGEDVQPHAWAGEEGGYLDEVAIPTDADVTDAGPAARTFETGEITVVHDVESDPTFEPWREAALARGFRSVAVVPFTHDEVVHGILVVYADRPEAFSPREVQAFEVLGEMVGYTISATQDRRLIETDARIELVHRLSGGESFLATVADRLDCPCRLLDFVITAGDGTLHYLAVEGSSPEAVEAVATDDSGATDIRHVRSDGETDVFEVRLQESILPLLRESGVRPVEAVAADGEVRVVTEAPRDVDVRTLTDRLETSDGDVSLVSKRESDSWQASPEPDFDLPARLTDRQHAALTAAYFGGYFDWPRDSTAEDVATALGISSPTFHQHLRHAQRKLLSAALGDRT